MKKYQRNTKLLSIGLSLFGLLITPNLLAQTEKELTEETVTKNKIEGHIHFLAADELRGREVGTPEVDISAKYIATSFMKYGVQPIEGSYFQNVPMEKSVPPSAYALKMNGNIAEPDNLMYLSGDNMNISEAFVYLNYGFQSDFDNAQVKGKVVVTMAGNAEAKDIRTAMQERKTKVELAKQAGAIGLVELFDEKPDNWDRYKDYFSHSSVKLVSNEPQAEKENFFSIWAIDNEGQMKNSLRLKMRSIEVTIAGQMKLEINSRNVVGMVEGTDPKLKEEYIIYSAHYDHNGVGKANAEGDSIYNGARDNAVGVVTVMSAAENIAKYPTKRSALFILFTAEEKGLLGSKYYADNPLIPMNQMVYCFNSDNGGYNDTSLTTIVGLGRTTAEQHIVDASAAFGLKAIDDPAGEQGLFDRSDNVNFAKKGVPAPTFSMGFTAFDDEIFKYYHQTRDNPESIDYDYLEKFFSAYVMSCRLIANDAKTPFWVKGDKYYEAGKSLYKAN